MTKKEIIERNIGLTFDFVSYLIDQPKVTDNLPDNFELEFIEKDFPKIDKNQEENNNYGIKKKFVRVRNNFELTK